MFYYRKRKATKKTSKPRKKYAKKTGLNKKQKTQVSKMIKGKRETFFLETVSYMIGQGVAGTYNKPQITPQSCFQSANRITMAGLLSADTFTSIGNDLNSNAVHTSGTRLYLTHGCRARDLNGIADEQIDGDQGYMKSHLQKIKIHAKALVKNNESTITDYQIPLNFRVLVVQVNGKKPAGSLPSFTNVGSTGSPSLFRNHLNEKKGIDDQITTPYEFQQGLRVDTNAFKVIRDIKFKLSNPLMLKTTDLTTNLYENANFKQFPATREIDLWLPQPKKPIRFDSGTQLPTNYDYRYYTLVFCTADSTYGSSNNVPTTEDRWCMESTSIARFQEY